MSSSSDSPSVAIPAEVNVEVWPAGKPIVRIHHRRFNAVSFNPGEGHGGRFDPIRSASGDIVPTVYGSNSFDGAASETVFHNVPVSGPEKRISVASLDFLMVSEIVPQRDLSLISLRGFGLKKLELTRRQIIDTDADSYSLTRAWAAALYEHASTADGIIWMSRQHDSSEAVVLFGTRVRRNDLAALGPSRSLLPPSPAWDEILNAANAAGIRIEFG